MQKIARKPPINLSLFIASLLTASLLGILALKKGENISSIWIIICSASVYIIFYRFYSKWIALKILNLDSKRATPAIKINDGNDFVPTNRWIVFGHHFAAIAGPGPLIGPTLATQFGYLPSILWIVIGAVIGGAVQDMIILFASVRRDGKSLGQMIKDEISPLAGFIALFTTLSIIIILIAVLGLIVVKALMHSPWGTFTVSATIPIAMFIGLYMFYLRPAKVLEASLIGVALFLLATIGGKWINENPALAQIFDHNGKFLAISIIIYGFFASAMPIWLLLAPRDYLSSFLKIGTLILLALALLIFQPHLQMPAITQFIDGSGPIFSGKIFPFLFITIACGAISGFHSLVASGTTSKIISNENDVRMVGYGSMLIESMVAIMAVICASILEPGVYFAINSPLANFGNDINNAVTTINSWGFAVSSEEMDNLAKKMGETSLFDRTGGAPSLAVGMANIFSKGFGGSSNLTAIWYHFAIMFEAIFILTTLDAGTRVARFMLQDLLANINKKLGLNNKHPNAKKSQFINHLSTIFTSLVIVSCWGYFLYLGVIDPNGGINILWPLFGISNQILAVIALALATTIIAKKHKKPYFLITAIPLIFLTITISSTLWQKTFSDNHKISFFALANHLQEKINQNQIIGEEKIQEALQIIFNQRLVGSIALIFFLALLVILFETIRQLIKLKRIKSNN